MRKFAGRAMVWLGVLLAIAPVAAWGLASAGGATNLMVLAPSALAMIVVYLAACLVLVVGGLAVMMTVQKQPGADTLTLDAAISKVLDQMAEDLPDGVVIERRIFKQADFISAAVDNVVEAIRDGALWVIVVLFLFMFIMFVGANIWRSRDSEWLGKAPGMVGSGDESRVGMVQE